MGFSGIGIWQLLIVLLIVMLLFGTKKLRSFGRDAGGALQDLRNSLQQSDELPTQAQQKGKGKA